jgi:tetratricopeptide (TPR) repeat protein
MNFEAWRHYLRGAMLQRRKHPLLAMDEYRVALAYDPDFLRAAHRLAYLLAGASRHDEAEHWFRETLRIDPRNADAWFNLGYFYDQQQRLAEAVDAFREAVRLRPRFDRAWYGLGVALAAQGHHADATAAFERAAGLQPMNGEVWYHLGMAYHTSGEDTKVQEVAEYLNRFDRKMTKSLIVHAGRKDLEHLVADYDPRF